MSFDKKFDLTAGVYFYVYNVSAGFCVTGEHSTVLYGTVVIKTKYCQEKHWNISDVIIYVFGYIVGPNYYLV